VGLLALRKHNATVIVFGVWLMQRSRGTELHQ